MQHRRIAVYGKGGIGKSTISANLSVALSRRGRKVLQVGCDPTRFLLHGTQPTTVLDYLRVTGPLDYRLADILVEGYAGIGCVEAGGPKPGVGCAGRGIISTFELLDQFKLDDRYDTTIYDVLGDVVCGGFAVPIRREYADTILIVTSGEFMALYAANNILRGIRNFDGSERRVAGLVFNRRNVEDEEGRVRRFAEAVGLPIFADVPRSDAFARAERENMTAMELADEPGVCAIFDSMAERLIDDCALFEARPLEDDELESVVLGTSQRASEAASEASEGAGAAAHGAPARVDLADIDLTDPNRYLSKSLVRGEPLHGCAFNGALSIAIHLRDAVVVAHSPKSCAFISYQTISSTGRRTLFEKGALLPASLVPNLVCTEMGEPEIVFGGTERLVECVADIVENRRPAAVIIVSSCPAGIIGDDVDRAVELATPECPVIAVKADGNMSGDYLQGMFMTYRAIASALVKPEVARDPKSVNVIAEKVVVTNTQSNYELISGWLSRMGVSVNCRYLYDSSVADVQNFAAAPLTLPAYTDYTATTLGAMFKEQCAAEVFERGFPIGFDESCAWLRALGERFGASQTAEDIIEESARSYAAQIEALRPALSGKRLMVITFNYELDWILKPALDCGMQIVKIGVLNYSQDEGFRTRLGVDLPVEEEYDRTMRADDIDRLAPDVLLTNYASALGDAVADTIPMCPDAGFDSGIRLLRRWARLLQLDVKGAWHRDGRLFDKYFS